MKGCGASPLPTCDHQPRARQGLRCARRPAADVGRLCRARRLRGAQVSGARRRALRMRGASRADGASAALLGAAPERPAAAPRAPSDLPTPRLTSPAALLRRRQNHRPLPPSQRRPTRHNRSQVEGRGLAAARRRPQTQNRSVAGPRAGRAACQLIDSSFIGKSENTCRNSYPKCENRLSSRYIDLTLRQKQTATTEDTGHCLSKHE